LRTGNPGNKGGGRPPSGLKEALEALRKDPKALKALSTAARNAKSKGFPIAWKLAERYDPERPSEKHDVSLTVGIAAAMREADQRLENARK
jgi:malonyl CoA-acyl carrier protein transacylase